jgi:acylphosphatase
MDDGRVEVYAIGMPEQLDALAGVLRRGPRLADVRGIDEQAAAIEKISGFRIGH